MSRITDNGFSFFIFATGALPGAGAGALQGGMVHGALGPAAQSQRPLPDQQCCGHCCGCGHDRGGRRRRLRRRAYNFSFEGGERRGKRREAEADRLGERADVAVERRGPFYANLF